MYCHVHLFGYHYTGCINIASISIFIRHFSICPIFIKLKNLKIRNLSSNKLILRFNKSISYVRSKTNLISPQYFIVRVYNDYNE